MMGGIFAQTGEDGDKHFRLLVGMNFRGWGCAGTALESADRSRHSSGNAVGQIFHSLASVCA